MYRNILSYSMILLIGAIYMAEEKSAYSQGAKVQREIGLLSVHPQVVIQGNEVMAVVQPFKTTALLRVGLLEQAGKVVQQKQLTGESAIHSIMFHLPKDARGRYRVVLEERRKGYWMPVANAEVRVLPGFWNQLQDAIQKAEQMEEKASESDPRLLRACWAVLAYAEDLLERTKLAETGNAWDLQRRLSVLRAKVKSLHEGIDPLEKKRGYQLRGYRSDLDRTIQLYSLYLPKGYGIDPEQKWPMVVMLHGAWSNHHLALRRVMGKSNNRGEDDARAKRVMPPLPDVPYIVVAPNGHETLSYRGFAERDVWQVMEEVQRLFQVDANRVYLTGLSMGGYGTGRLGLTYPDRFAAIAPVCGIFGSSLAEQKDNPISFQTRMKQMSASYFLAENALHLPVKLMHGDKDPVVPFNNSTLLHERLKELHYKTELELYPGVGHDAWVPAYEEARIFDWFSQFERNPYPKRVIYKTGNPQGGSSYWVCIDEPTEIRQFARIEAEIENSRIHVQTQNVQRFSLAIPEPLLSSSKVIQVLVDGQVAFHGTHGKNIHFERADETWQWVKNLPQKRLLPPIHGLHGVFEDKHVLVYGTAGTSNEDKEAQALATLKSLQGPWSDVRWDVLPEEAISKESLEDQHLVIFGTVRGSSFIQNHLDQLPLHYTDKKLVFGDQEIQPNQSLVFVYPNPMNPSRYVLIGTALTLEGLKSLENFASESRSLRFDSTGDFIIYNENGSPVAGGIFDKNWEIEERGEL